MNTTLEDCIEDILHTSLLTNEELRWELKRIATNLEDISNPPKSEKFLLEEYNRLMNKDYCTTEDSLRKNELRSILGHF